MIKVISTENTSIIAPVVANVLRVCLSGNDPTVLKLSSKCLGELSKIENNLVADCIVFELGLAIEWLRDNYEFRRLAAILILKEVAINASTFFFRFIKDYFDGMWPTLRDSKPEIFEAAREVLRESLRLVGERGQASQYYKKIFEDVRSGLKSTAPQVVHGSILALFELLRNPQDKGFMSDKFSSVCSTVINLKDSKDKRISMTILQLIPQLATYDEQLFKESFLDKTVNHMLEILKKGLKETEVVLGALGDLAIVLVNNY
jgi:FKBP12-rapamycin complex-associated protein